MARKKKSNIGERIQQEVSQEEYERWRKFAIISNTFLEEIKKIEKDLKFEEGKNSQLDYNIQHGIMLNKLIKQEEKTSIDALKQQIRNIGQKIDYANKQSATARAIEPSIFKYSKAIDEYYNRRILITYIGGDGTPHILQDSEAKKLYENGGFSPGLRQEFNKLGKWTGIKESLFPKTPKLETEKIVRALDESLLKRQRYFQVALLRGENSTESGFKPYYFKQQQKNYFAIIYPETNFNRGHLGETYFAWILEGAENIYKNNSDSVLQYATKSKSDLAPASIDSEETLSHLYGKVNKDWISAVAKGDIVQKFLKRYGLEFQVKVGISSFSLGSITQYIRFANDIVKMHDGGYILKYDEKLFDRMARYSHIDIIKTVEKDIKKNTDLYKNTFIKIDPLMVKTISG